MPIGAVALIVLAVATVLTYASDKREVAMFEQEMRDRYMVPADRDEAKKAEFTVIEAEGSKAPAVHALTDPHGIIPAVGEDFPSKPSIFETGGLNGN